MQSNKEVRMKECADENCTNQFKPYLSTDKYCSYSCYRKNRKSLTDGKKTKNKIEIPARSKSMINKMNEYGKLKKEFLSKPENKYCPVFPNKTATQIHHKKGRIGKLLLDTRYWLAVSHDGHEKIERNPIWAKQMGYSLSRLSK